MTQLLFNGPGRVAYPQKAIGNVAKKRVSYPKKPESPSSDFYIDQIVQLMVRYQARSREPESLVLDNVQSRDWAQLSRISKKIDWNRYPCQKQEIINWLIAIESEKKRKKFQFSRTVSRRNDDQGTQISLEEGFL